MLRLARRSVCTSARDTRELLRALLRESAQPVAVVTALLPASASTSASHPAYHGATLSSFTSIALDPLPLVAFSLRVPSRMASALSNSPASSAAHFVISVLSAAQPHLANRFARPDLYPHPFADPCVPYTTSRDGLPILSGALGALSCRLVGPSIPLAHVRDVRALEGGSVEKEGELEVQQVSGGLGLASELFVARVLRVEHVPPLEGDGQDSLGLHKLPLVYHRRRYTTVREHDS